MKPQNVIEHEHYFTYLDSNGLPIDTYEDVGRYDACLTKDDGAGVWSPSAGLWFPQSSYEKACRVAYYMAEYYEHFHPRSNHV